MSNTISLSFACPIWEYAAGAQRLQKRALGAIGNLDRCTPVREFHVAFKIPYMYHYITTLYMTQPEAIPNHVTPNVRGSGQ
jgi:hypothetical protein